MSKRSKGSKSGSGGARLAKGGLANINEDSEAGSSIDAVPDDAPEITDIPYELEPGRNIVTDEEFDELVSKGEFLEHHKELFKHELVTGPAACTSPPPISMQLG